MKNLMNLSYLLLFGFVFAFTSCSDDTDTNSEAQIDNYVIESTYDIQLRTSSGKHGCFELVFPIVISFEDGSSVEVNSIDELKEAIRSWKMENPDATVRPAIEFPIEVITQDGEMVSVDSFEELRALRKECRENYDGPGNHKPCFKAVYPLSVLFPNGTELSFGDRKTLKLALRHWKKEHPNADERPTLVFPITVVDLDGNEIIVESKEQLQQMKEDCRDN